MVQPTLFAGATAFDVFGMTTPTSHYERAAIEPGDGLVACRRPGWTCPHLSPRDYCPKRQGPAGAPAWLRNCVPGKRAWLARRAA
jgi:hypothetical protein